MKRTLILLLALFQSIHLFSQESPPVPEDKAVVYFVRAKGLGALVNFTYFDGEKAIGRFNAPKYMRYECEPGEHLFWARSENKSFVEANLEAGKIYLIEAVPKMGGLKASVALIPVNVADHKMTKIQKLLSKREAETFSDSDLSELQEKMVEIINSGMEKYQKIKEKGKDIPQLTPEMVVTEQDLIYVKKKKK